jgi:hypothetical protein
MTRIKAKCSECDGKGWVPHKETVLQNGEIVSPNCVSIYKSMDLCDPCGGSGSRMVDVEVFETPVVS